MDSPGAERILAPPDGETLHPAVRRALALHTALEDGDAASTWALSSLASRKGHTRESLLERWSEVNHGGYPEGSGVGTTIYSLAPLSAVRARVFADAPKSPRTINKPTPATLLAVLLFVWENDWVVDLPIYSGEATDLFLPALLTTPPPEGANLVHRNLVPPARLNRLLRKADVGQSECEETVSGVSQQSVGHRLSKTLFDESE